MTLYIREKKIGVLKKNYSERYYKLQNSLLSLCVHPSKSDIELFS
jgi:hypothetical protein